MRATYNVTNDRLKVWFDERLSQVDYDRATAAGLVYWHGSKCFTCVWRPSAEDFIRNMGAEIEEDDSPDDVEARVERFEKYAGNATEAATNGAERLETANTERRKRFALAAVDKGLSEAEHWRERIEGAIRHARRMEQPDVIARRIRKLEADHRRHVNSFTVYEPQPQCGQKPTEIWVGKGRGGYWSTAESIARQKVSAERWIAHLDKRLQYENALLEAAGGCFDVLRPKRKVVVQPKGKAKARDGTAFEEGGAAGIDRSYCGRQWYLVLKVNRSTVDIVSIYQSRNSFQPVTGPYEEGTRPHYHVNREEAYGISNAKTAEQVRAELPDLASHWANIQRILKANAERKATEVTA